MDLPINIRLHERYIYKKPGSGIRGGENRVNGGPPVVDFFCNILKVVSLWPKRLRPLGTPASSGGGRPIGQEIKQNL